MSNVMQNSIKFKNKESCLKFKDLLCVETGEVNANGRIWKEYALDFNKLIPLEDEESVAERYDKWGTKQVTEVDFLEDDLACYFHSAYSSPIPIFTKLAELGVEFNVGVNNEEIGSYCGIITTKEGKLVDIIDEDINSSIELFAFSILFNYPCIDEYLELYTEEERKLDKYKEVLENCYKAKGEVEEKMLSIMREYDILY